MDVDHFKVFNDTHGHQAGDVVLQTIGEMMNSMTRESDVVARWGGEEFIVIAAETDEEQACGLAEKIRKAIAAHKFAML